VEGLGVCPQVRNVCAKLQKWMRRRPPDQTNPDFEETRFHLEKLGNNWQAPTLAEESIVNEKEPKALAIRIFTVFGQQSKFHCLYCIHQNSFASQTKANMIRQKAFKRSNFDDRSHFVW
jgi:hypothetical protein